MLLTNHCFGVLGLSVGKEDLCHAMPLCTADLHILQPAAKGILGQLALPQGKSGGKGAPVLYSDPPVLPCHTQHSRPVVILSALAPLDLLLQGASISALASHEHWKSSADIVDDMCHLHRGSAEHVARLCMNISVAELAAVTISKPSLSMRGADLSACCIQSPAHPCPVQAPVLMRASQGCERQLLPCRCLVNINTPKRLPGSQLICVDVPAQ